MPASSTVAKFVAFLEDIAPLRLAEEWDNVGLLLGAGDWPATRILLTIDLTRDVLEEAIDASVNFIVAYHPPLFRPISSLSDRDPQQHILLRAARAGIAIYSPHTALDAAEGGINDWLARGMGEGDIRALQPHQHLHASQACKIVIFCPPDAVDTLRSGLTSIGAGNIGNYEQCSFTTEGQGTFMGTGAAKPVIGTVGRLERTREVRLEMVCSTRSLPLAVTTIRQLHPYEEPAFDIYPLVAQPERASGAGRRIVLDQPIQLEELAVRVCRCLSVQQLQIASTQAIAEGKSVQTLGTCAGAGGSMLEAALSDGCEVFLTGEMRHHDVLAAVAKGCSVILAGHTNTERGYLPTLRDRLHAGMPSGDVSIMISGRDADPLQLLSYDDGPQ
ncbi:MAG: Nif3-like dinuclear metal center hexameric protein [Phycisphaerales bacterium]